MYIFCNKPCWIQHVPPVTLTRYCLYATLLSIYVDVDVDVENMPLTSKEISLRSVYVFCLIWKYI